MKISYKGKNADHDNQFLAILSLGIINALKENLITYDDAWNWLFNIRTLKAIETKGFNKNIVEAIHLGTELGDVQRIIPHAFCQSCDEIVNLLITTLKESKTETDQDCIDYHLEITT